MAEKRITDVDFIDSLNSNESFFVNRNNAIKQINKKDVVFGIANGGTGATTVDEARRNIGAISVVNSIIELTLNEWNDNRQVINVNSVSSDNMVIVSPSPESINYKTYTECGVRCEAQSENTLTFVCEDVPNISLAVNIAAFI